MKQKQVVSGETSAQLALQFFALDGGQATPAAPARGGANQLDGLIRTAMAETLKGQDRETVAARMSEMLRRHVKGSDLDQWCAPSQPDRRAHGDALLALVLVTGKVGLLEAMAKEAGHQVLTETGALSAEFGALTLFEHEVQSQRKSLAARLAQQGLGKQLLEKVRNRK